MFSVSQRVGLIIILTFVVYIIIQTIMAKYNTPEETEKYASGSCLIATIIATSLILLIP